MSPATAHILVDGLQDTIVLLAIIFIVYRVGRWLLK